MTLRELRAATAAARSLDPDRLRARQQREDRARARLTLLLADHACLTVPGYRVARDADGLTIERLPAGLPAGWAQLTMED